MTLPAFLARLRALAAQATPGPYETVGAAIVWSPSKKVEQPGWNAAYLAAVDPQVVAALVVVAEEAERIADLGVHTRLKRALAALTAVAAPRTGGAR